MYFLHFNSKTNAFKVIAAGATITESTDGVCVFQSESREFLVGMASGIMAIIQERGNAPGDVDATELRATLERANGFSITVKWGD